MNTAARDFSSATRVRNRATGTVRTRVPGTDRWVSPDFPGEFVTTSQLEALIEMVDEDEELDMELEEGDEVVLDVEETTGSGSNSYVGPGVVIGVYPRGCLVDTGEPEPWWVPRRFWGTSLQLASGSTSS